MKPTCFIAALIALFSFSVKAQETTELPDTLSFTASPDDTEDKVREKEIHTLHMGLIRYVAKTPLAKYMEINFNQPLTQTIPTDKWNNWVFRSSIGGFLNGQKSFNYNYLNSRVSANRITEKSKLEISLNYNRGEDNFIIENNTIKSINHSRGATSEEILLRRKELETQYSYFSSFGISNTFGSIYNNVVNPRFGSSGGNTMVISF